MQDERKNRWGWFKSDENQAEPEPTPPPAAGPAEDQAELKPQPQPPEPEPESAPPELVSGTTERLQELLKQPDAGEQRSTENTEGSVNFESNAAESDSDPALNPSPQQAPFDPSVVVGPQASVPRRTRKKTLSKPELPRAPLNAEQKLLLLDTWQRSGLAAGDFASLVGVSKHTLYAWKKKFEQHGPAGLMPQPKRGGARQKMSDLTKRAIVMMKEAHPEWGCQRISDMLSRGPALPASPTSVARVLREAGYEMEEQSTKRHPDKVRSFERAKPGELWQTDLFTFTLKRQNRRVYLVAFMDDHSRFITGFGLHATQSAALVIEVLRTAVTAYGPPTEILTDNGTQYVTWRGKSKFTKELEKRGIRQIVAKPRRPQTLGKIERFWGTLWRECLEAAIFIDMADARVRIGHFIDWYCLAS